MTAPPRAVSSTAAGQTQRPPSRYSATAKYRPDSSVPVVASDPRLCERAIVKPSCPPEGSKAMKNSCQRRAPWHCASKRMGLLADNAGLSRQSHGRGSAAPALATPSKRSAAKIMHRLSLGIYNRSQFLYDLAEIRVARREHRFDAHLKQRFAILIGNYSSHDQSDAACAIAFK